MPQPDFIPALNRLAGILCRSMPQYLTFAPPYIPAGKEDVIETLAQIADDQRVLSDRISHLIQRSKRLVDTGEFRIEFTALHDLDIDFLIGEAIAYQKNDLASIEALVEAVRFAPAALSLTEEAIGMAKGHLESLTELAEEHPVTGAK